MRFFEFGQLNKEERLFKDVSIFSSGSHFARQSRTICAILLEGIIRNISVKSF